MKEDFINKKEAEVKTKETNLESLNKEMKEIEKQIEDLKKNINRTINNRQIETKPKEEVEKLQKNGEKNVVIMLSLLFPTKYPVKNNFYSSYNSLILRKSEFTFSFYDLLPSFLQMKNLEEQTEYSYVNIDNKVHTITQIVWLNDIYNQPDFSNLMNQFEQLNRWKKQTKNRLDRKILGERQQFYYNYKNGFSESDIDALKTIITEKEDEIENEKQNRESIQYGKNIIVSIVEQLIKSIQIFQRSVEKQTEKYETIGDNATNMIKSYNEAVNYRYRGVSHFKTKDKWDKIINSVKRDINNIRINMYINDKFMSYSGYNIEYTKDTTKFDNRSVIDELNSNYKEYTNFAENIKKLRSPNKESSNIYLQGTINKFLENREEFPGLFNYLMNAYTINMEPYDKLITLKSNELKTATEDDKKKITSVINKLQEEKKKYNLLKNTGVSIYPSSSEKDPYFEIFVQMNLIGGELNDSNKGLIDCMYQGESLGSKLEVLINTSAQNPWDLNNNRMFFDITKDDIKQFIADKENEKKEEGQIEQGKEGQIEQGKEEIEQSKEGQKEQGKEGQKEQGKEEKEKNPIKRVFNPLKKGFDDLTRKVRTNFMRLTRRQKKKTQ